MPSADSEATCPPHFNAVNAQLRRGDPGTASPAAGSVGATIGQIPTCRAAISIQTSRRRIFLLVQFPLQVAPKNICFPANPTAGTDVPLQQPLSVSASPAPPTPCPLPVAPQPPHSSLCCRLTDTDGTAAQRRVRACRHICTYTRMKMLSKERSADELLS